MEKGTGNGNVNEGMADNNGLKKIETGNGNGKHGNGICHDDSAPPVKAQTIDELHSLQKKKSAPSTASQGSQHGATSLNSLSEEERQRLQLQSIR